LRTITGQVSSESTAAIDKTRNVGTVTDWIAVDEDDMKPDAQVRQRTRAGDGVGRSGSADHEARGAENAAPVRLLDGGVDRFTQPEVVRGDDQPVQCANSRSGLAGPGFASRGSASAFKNSARIVSRLGAAQVLAFDKSWPSIRVPSDVTR
jgi:hypothetical protein